MQGDSIVDPCVLIMNRYIRAAFCVPFGILKISFTKAFHVKNFHCSPITLISPYSEISLGYGGKLSIGKRFKMRDGAKLRVRRGAECRLGDNFSMSSQNIIACRERIIIGDNVQLSPNVLIYDHDHDFRTEGGISAGKYKTAPVIIGNNVWIGANSVILRGSVIGDNAVIAAGSVVHGEVPSDSVYINGETRPFYRKNK